MKSTAIPKHDTYIATVEQQSPSVAEFYSYGEPQLIVAFGDYGVFDSDCYAIMSGDVVRNWQYAQAVRRLAPGRTVVDIGAGRDVNWSLESARAGARHVYAIEGSLEAFNAGLELIQEQGLTDRITLVHGLSTELELPERVDVCVSEIIGCIGSSEGVRGILADAKRRFLKPAGLMIPDRCLTRMAPISLPDSLHRAPAVPSWTVSWISQCFDRMGRIGDLRFCIRCLPNASLLSPPIVFEEMHFNRTIESASSTSHEISFVKSGRLDGFALWVELYCDEDNPTAINTFEQPTNWEPTFFPVFYPGVEVHDGDKLNIRCTTECSSDQVRPDYRVTGELTGRVARTSFDFFSSANEHRFRHCEFYRRLFAN